jgi:hypothetical protein
VRSREAALAGRGGEEMVVCRQWIVLSQHSHFCKPDPHKADAADVARVSGFDLRLLEYRNERYTLNGNPASDIFLLDRGSALLRSRRRHQKNWLWFANRRARIRGSIVDLDVAFREHDAVGPTGVFSANQGCSSRKSWAGAQIPSPDRAKLDGGRAGCAIPAHA